MKWGKWEPLFWRSGFRFPPKTKWTSALPLIAISLQSRLKSFSSSRCSSERDAKWQKPFELFLLPLFHFYCAKSPQPGSFMAARFSPLVEMWPSFRSDPWPHGTWDPLFHLHSISSPNFEIWIKSPICTEFESLWSLPWFLRGSSFFGQCENSVLDPNQTV